LHALLFAVDSFNGVAALDNLGLPESGDSISDVLQEAKIEADYLAKLQDSDGGFYFLVYPREREYESDVLPDQGDAQVVWPKTTSATAAAVAALAEAGSSPRMKQYYPAAAAQYLQQATLGWQFLANAINRYGKAGAYQKITHYGDAFTHDDELAWAAAAMFAATGDNTYQQSLKSWFDPCEFHDLVVGLVALLLLLRQCRPHVRVCRPQRPVGGESARPGLSGQVRGGDPGGGERCAHLVAAERVWHEVFRRRPNASWPPVGIFPAPRPSISALPISSTNARIISMR